jgi:hypothetical protein
VLPGLHRGAAVPAARDDRSADAAMMAAYFRAPRVSLVCVVELRVARRAPLVSVPHRAHRSLRDAAPCLERRLRRLRRVGSATVWRARSTTTWRMDSAEPKGTTRPPRANRARPGSHPLHARCGCSPGLELRPSSFDDLTSHAERGAEAFLWVTAGVPFPSFVPAFEGRGGKGLYEIRWVLPLTLSFY